MVSEKLLDRRTFLRASTATATAALIAGCGGPGGGDDGGGGEGEGQDEEAGGGNADEEMEDTEEGNESGEGNETGGGEEDTGGGSVPEEVDEYLSDVGNYDGVIGETGSEELTVQVGAEGNGGNFAFEPAAVQVTSGTEVVWEWTGEGGTHNVVHEDGEFESELTDEEGATFSHTFDQAGTYLYYCEPHRGQGMKGAVVVET